MQKDRTVQQNDDLAPLTQECALPIIDAPARKQRAIPLWLWFGAGLFLAFLFVPLFLYNMHQGLNHDEHQFVVSGWLWATEHLLPYRDYPYFHFPYLSFLNAALFAMASNYLLTARLASQMAGWLILVVLFVENVRVWRSSRPFSRFALAASITLILAFSPIFMFTSGRAWNHDLAALLAMLSVIVTIQALRVRQASSVWLFFAGMLLGFGAGVRLTVLPLATSLLAGIWLLGDATLPRRMRRSFWLLSGVLLACLPLFAVASQDWDAFWFDNFVYPQINTLFRTEIGYERAMLLPNKVLFFVTDVLIAEPRNLILPVAYLALGIPYPIRRLFDRTRVEIGMVALTMPFLFIGALAPTPAWHQYFFILYPFWALGVTWGLHTHHQNWVQKRSFWGVLGLLVVANTALWWNEYHRELRLVGPERWYTAEVERIGEAIGELVGPDERVLTVSPIYAIEGGRGIYPSLATGPFGLRAARFVSDAERRRFGFMAPGAEMDEYFENAPPSAILTGADPKEESTLLDYAQRHNYASIALDSEVSLWLRPKATWNHEIEYVTSKVSSSVVQPGELWHLLLVLRSLALLDRNYSVSVGLRGQNGRVLIQQDGWPWGRPTSTWQEGDLWFDGHDLEVPTDATPGLYEIVLRFYDADSGDVLPLSLGNGQPQNANEYVAGYVTVGDWPPSPANRLEDMRLGANLQMLGFDWSLVEDGDGMPVLDLTLYWQPDGALPAHLTIFVHVVDSTGAMVAQQDQPPLSGFYPVEAWRMHQPVADAYRIHLPKGGKDEMYDVFVGAYDSETGERVAITEAGEQIGDSYRLISLPMLALEQ